MSERSGLEQNHIALFIAVLLSLIGFAFRVLAIDTAPQGYTHDEVSELDVAQQVRRGEWHLIYVGGFARDGSEPAYYPFLAASQAIWGETPLGRRLPSAFAGTIGLACLYVLARRMFGARVGLLSLGAASVVWWSIVMGRVILREVLEVPLYALALYAFWRGFQAAQQERPRYPWLPFVLGGVTLGAAQYVHTIPRGLFMVFVLFGIYLLIFQRAIFKRVWRGLLIVIVVAEMIAAPLLLYATINPDVDNLPSFGTSFYDPEETLIDRVRGNLPIVLGQFVIAGDNTWEFNLPGRPIFEPVMAALFLLGVIVAIAHFRSPPHAFLLIVLTVSLLPSIMLDANFAFARLVSGQPATFALLAVGVDGLLRGLQRVVPARLFPAAGVLVVSGLLIATAINTVRDMFIAWSAHGQTRSTYNAEFLALGKYLDRQPSVPPVAQCTLWIVYPWRPRYHESLPSEGFMHFVQRDDVKFRWHDCRYSLVIPRGSQFILAHSDLQPLENFLGRGLKKPWLENAQPLDDVPGALSVDARSALQAKQAEWDHLAVTWPPEASITSTAQLPIDFNHTVELVGYQIKPQQVKPGDSVRVITYWRVTGEVPQDLIAFTHLYRTPTEVMAQQDQLDVDGSSLQPGDVFMQSHEFIAVPPGTPAGAYPIGVGLYRQETGERWPIYHGSQREADRIFLSSVQVTP
jgi:4-amino-4-deoxy-L-arabinose transferase-like glycosyltransferase